MAADFSGIKFGFLGGALPLDFCNTVDWHTSPEPHDRLRRYSDVLLWAMQAGIVERAECEQLNREASIRQDAAEEAFRRAISIREAMFRVFAAHARLQSPSESDIRQINEEWATVMRHAGIVYNGERYEFVWKDGRSGDALFFERPLFSVIRLAVELLFSPQLNQVRICEGAPGCGWLFLDTTKNKSRRWCSMRDCGNREKMRRYYGKRKKNGEDAMSE
jgi:predicted RNA-binding Zn ribbon-like protein